MQRSKKEVKMLTFWLLKKKLWTLGNHEFWKKPWFMTPACSPIDNCLTWDRENEEKLTVSCVIDCNWLCLNGVGCQFLFILPLSCMAVISGTAPGGRDVVNQSFPVIHGVQVSINPLKKAKISKFSPLFAPLPFLQRLCHTHGWPGVYGMPCYTPNKTWVCGDSPCQRALGLVNI